MKRLYHKIVLAAKRIWKWWDEGTPLQVICSTFTIITVINSLMMITGLDVPKQGVFAYIHMMSRLLIISLFIVMVMWKDVLEGLKKTGSGKFLLFYCEKIKKANLFSLFLLFTFVTAAYCLVLIFFSAFLRPVGGVNFYRLLLIYFLILISIKTFVHFSRKG